MCSRTITHDYFKRVSKKLATIKAEPIATNPTRLVLLTRCGCARTLGNEYESMAEKFRIPSSRFSKSRGTNPNTINVAPATKTKIISPGCTVQ
jgi:hypothetical protein